MEVEKRYDPDGKLTRLVVTRPLNGERFKTNSAFWYALQQTLDSPPFNMNVCKRLMHKDGHMMGNGFSTYYLRERKWKAYIYDPDWALEDVSTRYNKNGYVKLFVDINVDNPGEAYK